MSLFLPAPVPAEGIVFGLVYVIVYEHSHAVLTRVFPSFMRVRVSSPVFDHLHVFRHELACGMIGRLAKRPV